MQNSEPSGFPYIGQSATGFGRRIAGVRFQPPYTTDAGVPMAYDLACPVGGARRVRVRMKATDTFPDGSLPRMRIDLQMWWSMGRSGNRDRLQQADSA